MNFRRHRVIRSIVFFLSLFTTAWAVAQIAYVSDQLEITLRTGPGVKNKIIAMLNSGDELDVLQQDPGGYTQVRAPNGKTGWVLQRFLMEAPAARSRLVEIEERERQLMAQQAEIEQLREDLLASQTESTLVQQSNVELKAELQEVKQVAADTLTINEKNQALSASLELAEAQHVSLQLDNERLRSNTEQTWFVSGAGVILLGMLLGLLIPKLRFKKKRKWGDFSGY